MSSSVSEFPNAEQSIEAYRPTHRPPMSRLTLFDDGSVEGELFRIRKGSTSIGRKDCDINIQHDSMISDQHLSIELEGNLGAYRWTIKDLNSESGLWVRVRKIELKEGSEFLVGCQRFQFQDSIRLDEHERNAMLARIENGSYSGAASTPGNSYAKLSRSNYLPSSTILLNPIVTTASSSNSLTLIDGEYWIGRGPESAMRIPDDPFLAPKHVCITKESSKTWVARTAGAPNGMWVRMRQIIVNNSCTFQIGEQRCRFVCTWTRDEI